MTELIILGTSHISPESVNRIKELVKSESPDLICVELDKNRYYALKNENSTSFKDATKHFGLSTGFLAWFMSKLQKTLARKTGVMPGEEMLTAVNTAKENEIDYEFIDRDVILTMQKIRQISAKEKFKILFSLLVASVANPFSKTDIRKVPEDEVIEEAINKIKEKSPQSYKALIEDRDFYMSNTILELIEEKGPKKILAVVGAGHKDHMKEILSNSESIESIRLE